MVQHKTIHDWLESHLLYTKVNGAISPLVLESDGHLSYVATIPSYFHFPAPKICIQIFVKFGQMVSEKKQVSILICK